MDQSVCKNQSPHLDDGTTGQPEVKRYTISLWCEGCAAVLCEAENEERAKSWFFQFFQRYNQQTSPRLVLRIDDLGVVKDDQPVQELSEAEFHATARELKAARLTRPEQGQLARQQPIVEQHETLNESSTPKGTPSPPEIRCYRIWYWSAESDILACEAENENKAAEWFRQWCQANDDETTTHSLDTIEELDVEAAKEHEKMAARAIESKPMGREPGEDYFAALRRLKEAKQQQV